MAVVDLRICASVAVVDSPSRTFADVIIPIIFGAVVVVVADVS